MKNKSWLLIICLCLSAMELGCRNMGESKSLVFRADQSARLSYSLPSAGWLDLAEPRVLIKIESELDTASSIQWGAESSQTVFEKGQPRTIQVCNSLTVPLAKGKTKLYVIDEYAGPYHFAYTSRHSSKGRVKIFLQEVDINQAAPKGYQPIDNTQ